MITPSRLIIAGVLFFFVLASGFWVSRSGRPYSVLILTIHKLIALGTLALLIVTVVQAQRAGGMAGAVWIASGIAGLLFIGTIATGGMLSMEATMPGFVRTLHRVTPYLTLVACAISLYLISAG